MGFFLFYLRYFFGGMKEQDLKAIYAYLKIVKLIGNSIEKYTNLS